jgi:hypothetical protein
MFLGDLLVDQLYVLIVIGLILFITGAAIILHGGHVHRLLPAAAFPSLVVGGTVAPTKTMPKGSVLNHRRLLQTAAIIFVVAARQQSKLFCLAQPELVHVEPGFHQGGQLASDLMQTQHHSLKVYVELTD